MTTLLLLRHGRTTANAGGTLAGRSPGVHLDEQGWEQARALGARLAPLPLAVLVTSPLERCRQTADRILAARDDAPELHVDERFTECGYGEWTGRPLGELAEEPLWRVVQTHPSAVTFPGGEGMRAMQDRAVGAVLDWSRRVAAEHGPDAIWAVCTHGDVIKALVADALGLHLDLFQRITVDPASLTAVRHTELRPFLLRLNDTGAPVEPLLPPPAAVPASDAVVGGGAG